MEVLCYDGVTLLYLDLCQYDWSGSLMLWRCETIVILCYDNVTVLHFNVLTLCYYGSFMLWQCNIDVMMLWHYGFMLVWHSESLWCCDCFNGQSNPSQEGYYNSINPLVKGVPPHISKPPSARWRPSNMWGHPFY